MLKQFTILIIICFFILLTGCDSDKPKLNTPLPSDWPSDIPIMEGMVVVQVQDVTGDNVTKKEYVVTLIGTGSVDEAWDYYSTLNGWESEPLLFTDGTQRSAEHGFFGSSKGDRGLFVVIAVLKDEVQYTPYLNLGYNPGDIIINLMIQPVERY